MFNLRGSLFSDIRRLNEKNRTNRVYFARPVHGLLHRRHPAPLPPPPLPPRPRPAPCPLALTWVRRPLTTYPSSSATASWATTCIHPRFSPPMAARFIGVLMTITDRSSEPCGWSMAPGLQLNSYHFQTS